MKVLVLHKAEQVDQKRLVSLADERSGKVDQVLCLPRFDFKAIKATSPEHLIFPSLKSVSEDTNQLLRRMNDLLKISDLSFLDDDLNIQYSNPEVIKILRSLVEFHSNVQIATFQKRVENLKKENRIGRKPIHVSCYSLLDLYHSKPKMSLKQIGRKLGCSPQTVMRRLKKVRAVEQNKSVV